MIQNQQVLYTFNNHYYVNTFPQQYQIIYPSNINPSPIIIYPQSKNIVITPIKKEQNQNQIINVNPMRDINLPENYHNLNYVQNNK